MADKGRSSRRARVTQAIRDNLAEMLRTGIKDPRVRDAGIISVNNVELNRDMGIAQVFVSFLSADDPAIERAMDGLKAAAGFLRGPLGRRMNLARTPELRFVLDGSPEFAARLSAIVHEDEARAEEVKSDGDGED